MEAITCHLMPWTGGGTNSDLSETKWKKRILFPTKIFQWFSGQKAVAMEAVCRARGQDFRRRRDQREVFTMCSGVWLGSCKQAGGRLAPEEDTGPQWGQTPAGRKQETGERSQEPEDRRQEAGENR